MMERISTLESGMKTLQSEVKIHKMEKIEMQQQLEQLENDKETLEERVEILEAITVKSGKKS
jgi:chromosome segregation ATPase